VQVEKSIYASLFESTELKAWFWWNEDFSTKSGDRGGSCSQL